MKPIFTTKNCVDRRQGKDKFSICWESTKYQLLFHIVSLNLHNDSLWDCILSMRKRRSRESKWFIQGHMVTTEQELSLWSLSCTITLLESRIGYGWRNYGSKQGRRVGPISQAGLGSSSSREHLSLCILWNCSREAISNNICEGHKKRGGLPLVILLFSH